MNIAMMTVFAKVGLIALIVIGIAICENWDEVQFFWTCTYEELKKEFEKRNITKLFSFGGKH